MRPYITCHMLSSVAPWHQWMPRIPAAFDRMSPSRNTAVPLRLKPIEQRGRDALWIRYEVVGPKQLKGETMQKR